MKKAFYIFVYHDTSWGASPFLRGLNSNHSPDVFEAQISSLEKMGKIVSLKEGIQKTLNGPLQYPVISIWFDDGFKSNRLNALPILNAKKYTATISICSQFANKSNYFWRGQLVYLLSTGKGKKTIKYLKEKCPTEKSRKKAALDIFSIDLLELINEEFQQHTSAEEKRKFLEVFDDVQGIQFLKDNGWLISNHSARHFPVGESSTFQYFQEEFDNSEEWLQSNFNVKSDFWVLPFDRVKNRVEGLWDKVLPIVNDRYFVLCGNQFNKRENLKKKVIFRHFPPVLPKKEFQKWLQKI